MTHITNRRNLLAIFAILALSAGLAMFSVDSASAAGNGGGRVIAVTGIGDVNGQPALVHILAQVGAGQSDQAAGNAALQSQGVRALTKAEFSVLDNSWDQFFNNEDDFVTQRYNPDGEPLAGAEAAIEAARGTWSADLVGSVFAFDQRVPMTHVTNCPSLVKECKGKQNFDDNNDIGWVALRSSNTIAVTWSGINIDEADMAFNTNFTWSTDGKETDIETIALHELGHVAGLGHSADTEAIMFAYYSAPAVQRTLAADDIAGLRSIYNPAQAAPPGTISGTVFDAGGVNPLGGVTVSTDTGESDVSDANNGTYTIDAVPVGDRTVTASKSGYASGSSSVTVDTAEDVTGVNFSLDIATTGESTVDSISYSTSGGKNADKDLLVTIHVIDTANIASVEGAVVNIELTMPDGNVATGTNAITGSDGTVTYRLNRARKGTYSTHIVSVTSPDFDWDNNYPTNSYTKQ